ncbi:transmembrane protein [Ceratobasidium sp. AG-Ba]|nr:transmembrane protein [Ceratobasidium sp. AG-Ba]
MLSFARLTSFLLFVLSLSFLTCAAPTPKSSGLAVRDYGYGDDRGSYSPSDNVAEILVGLKADVDATCNKIVDITVFAEIQSEVAVLVAHVHHAAELVLALGEVKVDADVQMKIAVQVYAIIKVIIQAFAKVSARFGITAVLAIWAQIDACIRLLLVNCDVCIHGIVAVVLKLCVDVDVKMCIHAYLGQCAALLAL